MESVNVPVSAALVTTVLIIKPLVNVHDVEEGARVERFSVDIDGILC
jgi:hypothetical protein